MKLNTQRLRYDAILLLVAVIWGSAFAVQRVAAQHLGSFLFNGLRFLLAGMLLLPFARLPQRLNRHNLSWVITAGAILFISSVLQQLGLATTTAGNAGFITSLYVVLVPVLLLLLWRRHSHGLSWAAAGVAAVGAWLLSTGGKSLHLAAGDAYELLGALGWAFHVIVISKGAQKTEALAFSVGQCCVAAALNLAMGFTLERQTLPALAAAWWCVVYVGVFSTAIGYTLQIVGQRHSPPTDASLILSLESVFAALFGFLLLSERLGLVQILGCALILGAVVLAQFKGAPGYN